MKLSVEVYIANNSLEISGFATGTYSSPFLFIATNLTMTNNQYAGYYVKVTSGNSAGMISWITGNDDLTLFLQSEIPIVTDDTFDIYKRVYKRLDLFKDEKISVTSQIGNANDIGKLYTDYTQSFTIPASKTNNQILSHWYESSVDDGYDHRMRYDAYIEVNTHRFKNGTIQLEKADKKNGFIESYSITFYGNLVQLKDIIKDDKLQTLSFPQTVQYTSANVRSIITDATDYGFKFPLIGNANKYSYQDGTATDITTTTGAVKWNELFPAIKVSSIFQKIQTNYGITFTGSFFNLDQWRKLYLYLKKGLKMEYLSDQERINFVIILIEPNAPFPEFNLNNDTLTTNWNFGLNPTPNTRYYKLELRITTSSAFSYILYTYRDGNLFSAIANFGTQTMQIDLVRQVIDPTPNHIYTFKIAYTGAPFVYSASITYTRYWFTSGTNLWVNTFSRANTASTNTGTANINLTNYMPDMKIIDFLTGIIKAFNLMIIPRENNTYEFLPLEMYYNAGKTLDITEYTYENEMSINKPKLFKSINFKYEESNNILNVAFKSLYQQSYGDLIYNSNRITENSTYDIKLPFENVLFEVPKQGTQFQTATLIDKDQKPYIPKPMLIYCNGLVTTLAGADRIYTTNSSGGPSVITNYNRFSNEYDSIPTDPNHNGLMTMNFGNEQSSWLNVLAPQGLYFRHYKNFIDNLYNIKTRLIKVKALLPPSLLGSTVTNGFGIPLGIALNDRLIIRNKRYLINSFTTDLTTGETDLEILTDYRGVDAVNSVGYRFASFQTIDTDKEELIINVELYLNDYESFSVKGSIDFLIHDDPSNNISDIILEVTIPENTTGLDRSSFILIEYKLNGIKVHEEILIVSQTG